MSLELDTGIVEDKGRYVPRNILRSKTLIEMLEKVERLSVAEWAADEKKTAKKAAVVRIGRSDEDFEMLQKDNASLRGRMEQLQKDCSKALKEKQRLQDDIEELRQAQHTSNGRHVDALEKELREARETIAEYEANAKEQNQHITQSKQFQQLKKMVAQKNEALQDLRKRLLKYEPDADCDVDDE